MEPKNRQEEIHWNHQIDFENHMTRPRSRNKTSICKTRIQCRTCNVYIRWPSRDEIRHYHKNKNQKFTLSEWNVHFLKYGHKSPSWIPVSTENKIIIKLNVAYKDKDVVKKYNAKWYEGEKYWYTYTDNNKLEHLLPWMNEHELSKLHEFLSRQHNYNSYNG